MCACTCVVCVCLCVYGVCVVCVCACVCVHAWVQHMDFDYHSSFQRLAVAYRDSEREACESLMQSGDALVEQSKSLNLENDLHYFLSEYSSLFTAPNYFQFSPFEGDDVSYHQGLLIHSICLCDGMYSLLNKTYDLVCYPM